MDRLTFHTVSQNFDKCVGLQTIQCNCIACIIHATRTFFLRIIFKIMWTYYQKYNYIHFLFNFINSVCISEVFFQTLLYIQISKIYQLWYVLILRQIGAKYLPGVSFDSFESSFKDETVSNALKILTIIKALNNIL